MAKTTYFWQGGRKIEIQQDDSELTIQAKDDTEVKTAASEGGIELGAMEVAAPGLVRTRIVGDPENSINRLRSTGKVVHRLYRDKRTPENEYLITESFFIKFKTGTSKEDIDNYFKEEHLVSEQALGDNTFLARVTDATGRNPIRTANAAAAREDVLYAEPNLIRSLEHFSFIPPDDLFSEQWHLYAPNDRLPELKANADISAPDAWQYTIGKRDIVVAIADDGFDLTHPDLQGEGKVIARLNANVNLYSYYHLINWDEDVHPRGASSPYESGNYHGTPCMGVAVAEANGKGVVGVAPGCSTLAVRFPIASMSDAHFSEMFRKISPLADIVSCSWGFGPSNTPLSSALYDEIERLARSGGRRGKGLVFCVAAGNNNCPVKDLENRDTYKFRTSRGVKEYDGPIDRWIAAHPDVITVSACTSRKTRSAYSSWGEQIWVCAPSDNWDDLRQVTVKGLGITTTDNEGCGPGTDFTKNSRYTNKFGGTSSATPTVAGVCGLILSANDSLTSGQVKELLKETADNDLSLESDTPVNKPGDFDENGHSLWFGYGKVNAREAVKKALPSGKPEEKVEGRAEPNLLIPDQGEPITSEITFETAGEIIDIRVSVDISHTYIGDLRVDLISPNGRSIVLHNNAGGAAKDLLKIYGVHEIPSLKSLIGNDIKGTWQIQVRDTLYYFVGKLNRWGISARIKNQG